MLLKIIADLLKRIKENFSEREQTGGKTGLNGRWVGDCFQGQIRNPQIPRV
jgi:hypothetical protein